MGNELLFFITIGLYFSMMLCCHKLFGKTGLYLWICLGIVVSNIEVIKMVDLFGMSVTLGNVVYSSTFLATDILTEKYGEEAGKESVKMGFFTLISFVVITQMALLFIPNSSDFAHEALKNIFSLTPRLCIAGILTYLLSQTFDIWLFLKIKEKTKGKHLWLRNNLATGISQLLDTTVYTVFAFSGVFSWPEILSLIITSYIIKIFISVLDTPFLYIAQKMKTIDDVK